MSNKRVPDAKPNDSSSLRAVIRVDPDKCVNCHRCIAVCPVKMANDGSGSHVHLNEELCIGCGSCIEACTHDARVGIDDSERFFADLETGADIVAIVAPAVASNFPGQWLNLNGWLASRGVKAFYDVSFGAELTIRSYLEYAKAKAPSCVISQPCPTLVNFIEIYRPELIPFLAPADSPIAHTMKMVREFFPAHAKARFAVLTPCYSKRRELDEIGIGDYNVSFKSIKERIDAEGLKLETFPERPYDGPVAERATLFPVPGGLIRTAERDAPGIATVSRRIEGHPEVYHYLAHFGESTKGGSAPLFGLIDCLNCEQGCNAGPGSLNRGRQADMVDAETERRGKAAIARLAGAIHANAAKTGSTLVDAVASGKAAARRDRGAAKRIKPLVDRYWKAGLYGRRYVDRSAAFHDAVKVPSRDDIASIYTRMHKNDKRDVLNCGACGYNSCEQMAVAIHNGLNRAENCRHYMAEELVIEKARGEADVSRAIEGVVASSAKRVDANIAAVESLAATANHLSELVATSTASITQMVAGIDQITGALSGNSSAIAELEQSSVLGEKGIDGVVALVNQISAKSRDLGEASGVIKNIAGKTNLLAMNAAIEAAHAGSYGSGFAVVADEIRALAENAGRQASSITKVLSSVSALVAESSKSSIESQKRFSEVVSITARVRGQEGEIKEAVTEQEQGGRQIVDALQQMNDEASRLRNESRDLLDTSRQILADIRGLAESESVHMGAKSGSGHAAAAPLPESRLEGSERKFDPAHLESEADADEIGELILVEDHGSAVSAGTKGA